MKQLMLRAILVIAMTGVLSGTALADSGGKGKAYGGSKSNRQSEEGATRGLDRANEVRSDKSKGKAFDPDREQYGGPDHEDKFKKEKEKSKEKYKKDGDDDDLEEESERGHEHHGEHDHDRDGDRDRDRDHDRDGDRDRDRDREMSGEDQPDNDMKREKSRKRWYWPFGQAE